jgi:hypothetical protein
LSKAFYSWALITNNFKFGIRGKRLLPGVRSKIEDHEFRRRGRGLTNVARNGEMRDQSNALIHIALQLNPLKTPVEHADTKIAQSTATVIVVPGDRAVPRAITGINALTLQASLNPLRAFWSNPINQLEPAACGKFSQVIKRGNLEFLMKGRRRFRADTR